MTTSSKVDIQDSDAEIIVQGFRGSSEQAAYVFIGIVPEAGSLEILDGIELSTENAHILSEELRKQAEFANSERPTTQEEK